MEHAQDQDQERFQREEKVSALDQAAQSVQTAITQLYSIAGADRAGGNQVDAAAIDAVVQTLSDPKTGATSYISQVQKDAATAQATILQLQKQVKAQEDQIGKLTTALAQAPASGTAVVVDQPKSKIGWWVLGVAIAAGAVGLGIWYTKYRKK
jgi:chromosome segregation ATPase